ncbi:unnamed protein product [Triticum turgidum subsp. durum]|uniref:R13L1/DRL21-like LRR repeat region domain-containing protein n=1 Tax=Triticum turgidum subsp. durum TaxID=4567 RepID=A0A9R0V2Q3_TRITD|nr:unnamed protein product [Triticum turgidum subsp. durum]
MPPELGKLTKLQTLTSFVAAVTGPDCSDVAELQHLNLGGQLELCWVENVEKAEAEVANLGNKKDLRELTLRWTCVGDNKVLENFEPHDALQVLKIYSYGGKCIGMLQNMVGIHLFHCERLQFLFRCGTSFTFPKLKELTLENLLDFDRWWEINEMQEEQIIFPVLEKLFIWKGGKLIALPEAPLLQEACSGGYRSVHSAFPTLTVLEIKDLENFQRWNAATEGERILFPQLEELSVYVCPKVIDLPEAPKLSMLEVANGKKEILHSVDRCMSSLTNLILNLEYTDTTSEAECTSIVPVDNKEKWSQKSSLTIMKLRWCNSLFGEGALEQWDYFVHLENLEIDRCDVLVQWPEKVFESLVSLRRLVITNCENMTGYARAPLESLASERSQHPRGLECLCIENCPSLIEMFNVPASLKKMDIDQCIKLESIFGKQQGMEDLLQGSSCSEAIMPAAVSELPSSPMNHFCPCLEDLHLVGCGSLPAVLNLPSSLKAIFISDCTSIQVLSCQPGGLQKPEDASEPSATAAREHSLPPCLETLYIWSCTGMLGEILRLPTSLRKLRLEKISGLTSLESLSEEHPPSLESLELYCCTTLASLPNEPEAYGSLQELGITDYLAIKKLPRCLRRQLGSINNKKYLDAQYEVMAFKLKTWKEIPRLVREQWKACRN